jgi:hypothetical protein
MAMYWYAWVRTVTDAPALAYAALGNGRVAGGTACILYTVSTEQGHGGEPGGPQGSLTAE